MSTPDDVISAVETGTTIGALEVQASRNADALAFSVDETGVTWRELSEETKRLAAGLDRMGLVAGGRVALVLRTGIDLIALLLAAHRLRAAPVVLNPGLPWATIARRVGRIRCTHVVISDETDVGGMEAKVVTPAEVRTVAGSDRHAGVPDAEDCAFLQTTSGTTGDPKVVVIPQRVLAAYMRCVAGGFADDEVTVGWVPLYHDMGLVHGVLAPVFCGRPSYLLQPSLRNLRAWLETIDEVGGTYTFAPDFAYRIAARLVDPDGLRLDSLRIAVSGGEPVKLETIRQFEARFGLEGIVRPGYGLAESTLSVARVHPGEPLATIDGQVTCGRPREDVRIRIVDPEGNDVGPREKGEIFLKSLYLFAGYLDDEEATREVLRDGWLRTGDLGALDEEGRLYVYGRLRAMIKRAGSTIAPREIEEAVDGIPAVRGSAAVGVPRDEGSERIVVVAEVAGNEGDREEIRAEIAGRVRDAMGFFPDEVFVLGPRSIPRTNNGKIRYGELRERYRAGTLGER